MLNINNQIIQAIDRKIEHTRTRLVMLNALKTVISNMPEIDPITDANAAALLHELLDA